MYVMSGLKKYINLKICASLIIEWYSHKSAKRRKINKEAKNLAFSK